MPTNRSILLVDDEPAVLNALKRSLRSYFPHVYTANNGQQALELLAKHPIQLVISDFRMPGMNGADLVIEINRRYPQIMSIILSGQADISGLSRALNEGGLYKFLLKPWEPNYLLQTILQCFSEKEHREEFDPVSGLKTLQALNKQISLLQSLVDHPYLVLVIEWSLPFDDQQRLDISQHITQQISESESLYQQGSRWFWVTHRLTFWYQFLFRLHKSFQVISFVGSGSTAAPVWRIVDIEFWKEMMNQSEFKDAQSASLIEELPIYWYGKEADGSEIKQLLSIYRDLMDKRFCAFYQPQENIVSGEVVAFEALVRRVLDNGLYSMPDSFFPILEKYQLIPELTAVMVRDILTFLTQSAAVLRNITIGVNVPGKMLIDGSFYRLLLDIAAQVQAEHILDRLSVEITEHDLIADFDAAKRELYKLKELGIRCALDDFGKGYSGYEYLCEIPFDIVKIDGRFIQSLGSSDSSTVIVQSMIYSIKSLNMQVIAEWVDLESQYQILQEMGCDMVQGYLISTALAPELVLTLMNLNETGDQSNANR
ncbi:TPA: EAL domain-containing protein [Vibrio cholerae]